VAVRAVPRQAVAPTVVPDLLIEDHRTHTVLRGDPNALRAEVVPFSTLGAQRTLILLVNFTDKRTQNYTIAETRVLVEGVSDFYRANSFGQTWLTPDVYGYFTIGISSAVCDYNGISTAARTAAMAAGVDVSSYPRWVYVFPQTACGWWGLGSVGGMPSQAWINGSLELQSLGHEMGHNFGLMHAHSRWCGTTAITEPCQTSEYGDPFDIMGYSTGSFDAYNKELLGWLGAGVSPPLTLVSASGAYAISTYDTLDGLPKALKIDRFAADQSAYYLEKRAWLDGVTVRTANTTWGSGNILDMTPADGRANFSDSALVQGARWTDTVAGITLTASSVSATGATITVTYGAAPPPPPPTTFPVLITADIGTKIVGTVDPTLTYTASGFQGPDTAATVLRGVLTRAPGELAGGYAIGQGSLIALQTASTYAITFIGAAFTITPVVVPPPPPPAPDFTVSASVLSQSVAVKKDAFFTLTLASVGGFVGKVTIKALPLSQVHVDVSPHDVTLGGTKGLTQSVTVKARADKRGAYVLRVQATSGGLNHVITLGLDVK